MSSFHAGLKVRKGNIRLSIKQIPNFGIKNIHFPTHSPYLIYNKYAIGIRVVFNTLRIFQILQISQDKRWQSYKFSDVLYN